MIVVSMFGFVLFVVVELDCLVIVMVKILGY